MGLSFKVGQRDYAFTVDRLLEREPIVEPIIHLEWKGTGVEVVVEINNKGKTDKTVLVRTRLPGSPQRNDTVAVKAGRLSQPLNFTIFSALPGDVVEVALWEYGGDRAVATQQASVPEKKE